MRKKKIRGHNRQHRQIDIWQLENLSFDLKAYLLNEGERYVAKIRVHPWNGLSLINSDTPQPKGKTKQKMLNGLLDIYENWKNQLEQLGQPYYLKVWLFEPRFSKSQVVGAIGGNIGFYENIFYKPETDKILRFTNCEKLKIKLSNLNWEYLLDEDHYDNTEVGEPEQYASNQDYLDHRKWFDELLKKPHRKEKLKQPIGDAKESYSFKRGDLWLGR
ncbi:MAG: hypothetical protein ABIP95_08340 [Pelobium sp.]